MLSHADYDYGFANELNAIKARTSVVNFWFAGAIM